MARVRALDYNDKEDAILQTAARLFSREGVERTSMAQIAAECGYSKALLYHYYDSKESILYDIVSRHVALLIQRVTVARTTTDSAESQLGAMVAVLLDTYGEYEDQHRIQLAGLTSLSPTHLTAINQLERQLVALFADVIAVLMPDSDTDRLLKPVTMSLFGMLNWHYMWFREQGPMSRAEYADMATRLILHGARELSTRDN